MPSNRIQLARNLAPLRRDHVQLARNLAALRFLSGRCRMGDPLAAERCRRILRRGMRAPCGHPHRELARLLAAAIRDREHPRAAFLPQRNQRRRTRLALRLQAIFESAGGVVHVAVTGGA